jgi:hypothetical protein
MSKNKVLIVAALVGAVAFGLLIGYLLWTYDSFPAEVKPFGDYANVTSTRFNGTEYAFTLEWLTPDAVPQYAQLSSPTSQAATTDICELNLSSASRGQTIFMPFGLAEPSTSLSNVELSIAVKPVGAGSDFTIVYSVDSVLAVQGDIQPQNLSCARTSAPI